MNCATLCASGKPHSPEVSLMKKNADSLSVLSCLLLRKFVRRRSVGIKAFSLREWETDFFMQWMALVSSFMTEENTKVMAVSV
ncbi:hypothetical protein CEXT_752581 [Caerostris extrusa]|uniref:Uncharacterized protein n=1 Tax=Caerostris extrusa TaxID=172846 RepID=A0AAV4S7M5_CAEEX|nr:hypothetical protein CEXT_752581 [Caerostris extrusa]